MERLCVGETHIPIRVVLVNLYVVAVDQGADPVRRREDRGEQFLFRPATMVTGRLHHVRLELSVGHIDRSDVPGHIQDQRRDPELHCARIIAMSSRTLASCAPPSESASWHRHQDPLPAGTREEVHDPRRQTAERRPHPDVAIELAL